MDKLNANLSRRKVFAAGGTAGALAAVGVLPRTQLPAAPLAAALPEPDKEAGYQVTPHVLRYYETTRV